MECLHDRLVLGIAYEVANSADPLLHLSSMMIIRLLPACKFIWVKSRIKRTEKQMLLQDHMDKPQHPEFFSNIETLNLSQR